MTMVTCPFCKQKFAVFKGQVLLPRHYLKDGTECSGSWLELDKIESK